MLKGYDIVMCGFADWHGRWGTGQQIASRLVPDNRVLHVDVPRSFLRVRKETDPRGRGRWHGPRLQEVEPNLFVYHPPRTFLPVGPLPVGLATVTLRANSWLLTALVRRCMDELRFDAPIVWNLSPLHGRVAVHFPQRLNVYDECDVWANYMLSDREQAIVNWIENRQARDADLIFMGTDEERKRRERLAEIDQPVHVVLNGTDVDHFRKAQSPGTPVPEELRALPRPIVGSIGVIDSARFDFELIAHLATSRPEWSFVFVGPVYPGTDPFVLEQLPNVHLIQSQPIAKLPQYLRGMDVTIIPYRLNDITRYIYPLKMAEYLAAGKPTVVPAMPALLPYNDVVYVARSHDEFLEKTELALRDDDPERLRRRDALVRRSTWEQHVETKCDIIRNFLDTRGPDEAVVRTAVRRSVAGGR